MFPRSWLLVDEMLSEGRSKDEIIAKLNDKFLIPQDEILDNFTNCIDQIRMREEKCDIRISDFILKHYRERPMFFDIGHPTDIVMKEMWRQVCDIIGVEAELEADVNGRMDEYEDPILPCVTYALRLQYDRSRIRESVWNWRLKEYMDLNEYVEEYIWWKNKSRHGRLLKEMI